MKSLKVEKFKSLSLAALLIASVTFVACSSDDESIEQPTNGKYTMTIQASKSSDATTRALVIGRNSDDTKNELFAKWAEGEVVKVYEGDNLLGTLTPDITTLTNNDTECVLKGTLDNAPSASGVTLTLKFNTDTYGGQDGTLSYIANHCDYAEATTTVSVSGTTVTGSNASFTNKQAIAKFTLVDKANTATKLNASSLSLSFGFDAATTATLTAASKYDAVMSQLPTYNLTPAADAYTTNGNGILYIAIPDANAKLTTLNGMLPYPYNNLTTENLTFKITANVGGVIYTYTKTGFPFENNKYYEITVKMKDTGALCGKFTINGSGDQVYFSQGNLQYQASTSTWRFAEHQWDYVGDATYGNVYVGEVKSNNASISSSYTGWIDLFGWGTSGISGYTPIATNYQPYSTSTSNTQYNPYGSTSTNLYDGGVNAGKADWGYNAISNGGNAENQWRTLTKDEWTYVFDNRTSGSTVNGTSSARYTEATINTDATGINGVILFPDGVTITNGEATSWGNINNTSNWGTKCTTAQWTALEAKGCVFLPAAGYRSGTTVYSVSSYVCYWSSSYNSNVYAYYVRILSNTADPQYSNGDRSKGSSVRLVRDAN